MSHDQPILDTITDRLNFLNHVEFFASLPDDLRQEMADTAREHILSAGEVLVYQGDPSAMLYLLMEGRIELESREVYHSGALIDPAATLSGQPHSARAVA